MWRAALLGLLVLLATGSLSASAEQDVRPIVPRGEQEVEAIVPPGGAPNEQIVRDFRPTGEQQVEPHVEPSPAEKAVTKASKVVTGVAAAGAALGAMAAMLLFI